MMMFLFTFMVSVIHYLQQIHQEFVVQQLCLKLFKKKSVENYVFKIKKRSKHLKMMMNTSHAEIFPIPPVAEIYL